VIEDKQQNLYNTKEQSYVVAASVVLLYSL